MKRFKKKYALIIGLSIFVHNCKKSEIPIPIPPKEEIINVIASQEEVDSLKNQEHSHWGYEEDSAPEHWVELGYTECGGDAQSPIDILTTRLHKDTLNLLTQKNFKYKDIADLYEVYNTAHALQYNLKPENKVEFNGKEYMLVSLDFHTPAQHLINGVRYPLELQLTHLSADKEVLMLSFLMQEGEENIPFNDFLSALPLAKNEEKTIQIQTSLLKNIIKPLKYYHYTGSLTTPPCTQGVDWFIMQNPIPLADWQLKKIQSAMSKNNTRPTQPLNNRIIIYN